MELGHTSRARSWGLEKFKNYLSTSPLKNLLQVGLVPKLP